MRFIETPIFTRAVEDLLADEEYHHLQLALFLRPESGALIPRSSGLRKIRWSLKGKGKRGGCRIIYYWDELSETYYMLYIYRKSDQEDLTPQQLRALSRLVREEFG